MYLKELLLSSSVCVYYQMSTLKQLYIAQIKLKLVQRYNRAVVLQRSNFNWLKGDCCVVKLSRMQLHLLLIGLQFACRLLVVCCAIWKWYKLCTAYVNAYVRLQWHYIITGQAVVNQEAIPTAVPYHFVWYELQWKVSIYTVKKWLEINSMKVTWVESCLKNQLTVWESKYI